MFLMWLNCSQCVDLLLRKFVTAQYEPSSVKNIISLWYSYTQSVMIGDLVNTHKASHLTTGHSFFFFSSLNAIHTCTEKHMYSLSRMTFLPRAHLVLLWLRKGYCFTVQRSRSSVPRSRCELSVLSTQKRSENVGSLYHYFWSLS